MKGRRQTSRATSKRHACRMVSGLIFSPVKCKCSRAMRRASACAPGTSVGADSGLTAYLLIAVWNSLSISRGTLFSARVSLYNFENPCRIGLARRCTISRANSFLVSMLV